MHNPLAGKLVIRGDLGVIARFITKLQKGKRVGPGEKLSYKKLMKRITTMHPTDPETMEKLDLEDSITVNKYLFKLVDAVGCLYCYSVFRRCFKFLKAKLLRRKQKYYLKPDSMKDVPDSDSDSEANDTFKGLSPAAIYLGEGAVLYLQMMKTFAFLFLFLTILNIPVFWMYASMTEGNNYSEMVEVFQYFTLGNLGKGNPICGYSNLDYGES